MEVWKMASYQIHVRHPTIAILDKPSTSTSRQTTNKLVVGNSNKKNELLKAKDFKKMKKSKRFVNKIIKCSQVSLVNFLYIDTYMDNNLFYVLFNCRGIYIKFNEFKQYIVSARVDLRN